MSDRNQGTAKIIITFLLLCVCAVAAQDSKTTRPKVVGMFRGTPITEQELNRAADHQLANWEMQRLEAEASFTRGRHRILELALDGIIEDKILAAESAKLGIGREAYLATALAGKVKEPTPADIQAYYEANRQLLGNSLNKSLINQITEYLKVQNTNKAKAELLEPLKQQYGARTMLDPLRVAVKTVGSPSRGQEDAPITLVEFSDFACPNCAGFASILRQMEAKYGKQVRLVYKNFPLIKLHPSAEKAAEAAFCAADQHRFWEMHDLLFQEQGLLQEADLDAKAAKLKLDASAFNACLSSGRYAARVRDDMFDGARVGVSGTPALFVDGLPVPGVETYAEISATIDREIATRAAASGNAVSVAVSHPPRAVKK